MTRAAELGRPDVIVAGDGGPLVLAHGAGGAVDLNFGQVIDTLSPRRRLIGVNYPGSGATPRQSRPLELEELADGLVAAAVADGHDRFPILGLSLGCAVAITAAHRHPDRVSGLFLTVGFARADAQIRLVVDVWRHLAATDPTKLARLLVALSSPDVLSTLDLVATERAVADTVSALPDGGPDQALLASTVDVTTAAEAVAVPTTVVVAGQDRIVLPTTTRALARTIPGARVLEYPDAGHIFTPSEASAWIDDIGYFLDTHGL
ncbi:alpha/beta hydrolase [Williamsia sp. Leaf354]|jgi:pimeloyl-ACP methyl ester carboxylesterase|uniref:alpha/beta fold hydrolase n=1 Tax=Williamsia sp. Leaf354 TaxID=1736349 RepID=UPI0006FCBC85|nr:alpha/beta fold hydrolase [Williamsia sp. Leaf354]KQR98002.1 alpha/beta hydrolase [Williamsia sp. Leaf354]